MPGVQDRLPGPPDRVGCCGYWQPDRRWREGRRLPAPARPTRTRVIRDPPDDVMDFLDFLLAHDQFLSARVQGRLPDHGCSTPRQPRQGARGSCGRVESPSGSAVQTPRATRTCISERSASYGSPKFLPSFAIQHGRRRGRRRAGWPWRLPARAPTDPDVLALTHPVPQPTVRHPQVAPEAIRSSYVDMLEEPRCVQHVSLDRVCRPTPRFPPQGPPGRVPLLHRYYQSATTSCRPSRRTSLPSFGGTSVFTRSFRSPADECAAEAWSW